VRRKQLTACLFFAAAVLLLIPSFAGTKGKNHPRSMGFGGTAELGENLHVVVLGAIGPPAFFRSLQSVDSSAGTTFQNEAGEVRFFPEHMTITLRILGPLDHTERSVPLKKLDHDLMESLRFKIRWKRGMRMRPVKEFRLLAASESSFADLDNFGLIRGWTYEMVLEDSEVPVTDHLVLYISSPEDKVLARLSAFL